MIESYLGQMAWFCSLIEREQVFDELLPLFYRTPGQGVLRPQLNSSRFYDQSFNQEDGAERKEAWRKADRDANNANYTHRLALVFGLLASGAAGNLTLPLGSTESQTYNRLAAAALQLNSVFGKSFDFSDPTSDATDAGEEATRDNAEEEVLEGGSGCGLETVQAVMMYAAYEFFCGRRGSLEGAWKVMSLGLGLASSVRLLAFFSSLDVGLKLKSDWIAQRPRPLDFLLAKNGPAAARHILGAFCDRQMEVP